MCVFYYIFPSDRQIRILNPNPASLETKYRKKTKPQSHEATV